MSLFFAHSGSRQDLSDWQPLHEHLLAVARGTADRATAACPHSHSLRLAAHAAGLLHDLGKYRPEFQLHIRSLPVQKEMTYHKQAGAAKAYQARHWPTAFAIAGHHGGLPDAAKLKDLANGPSGNVVAEAVWPPTTTDCARLLDLDLSPLRLLNKTFADLFTRLLFSCLVDADWADTAEHQRQVRGEPPDPLPPVIEPNVWLERVLAFIASCAAACPHRGVAGTRGHVLRACLDAASRPPGLFSLTVPTGGGKTLSGLAFALTHARVHGHRRVIYVAPYLSILDQNARVIREALGFDPSATEVFEHHSLAEPPGDEDEDETRRQAAARRAENWDAPVILTTNVQFFESLFANKPGRCRKLHNVARSVILLDECQTLPPGLVAPTCSMLGQLTREAGCSIVLCTATQPAFDHADMPERLRDVREIVPPDLDLFVQLRRVTVTWPMKEAPPLTWAEVASQMREQKAALCVVNTRRAARELFELLKPDGDAFHLSTSMCPAHRLAVLARVKQRLHTRVPCYLVSTQLIEAGVDIDFSIVLRELAPLEAIIQASGRCNREGLLNGPGGSGGRVVVFRSQDGRMPPDRWYHAGRQTLEQHFLNAGREPRIDEPSDIRDYFERLYRAGTLDAHGIEAARQRFDFPMIAEKYRLIDDAGVAVVVATWEEHREGVARLLEDVRRRPNRANFRKLTPFQVNLRAYELDKAGGAVVKEDPELHVWRGNYDRDLGLTAGNIDQLLVV